MTDVGGIGAARLKSFIERIEHLEEDKAGIAADIKDVYGEAKGEGFDTKVLRKVVARRRKDPQSLREEEELLDLYEHALQGDLFARDAADRLDAKAAGEKLAAMAEEDGAPGTARVETPEGSVVSFGGAA